MRQGERRQGESRQGECRQGEIRQGDSGQGGSKIGQGDSKIESGGIRHMFLTTESARSGAVALLGIIATTRAAMRSTTWTILSSATRKHGLVGGRPRLSQ